MDFIELDIMLTKDQVPVVFHDNNTERMTNIDIKVAETTYADLKKLDLSVKHPFR